ncbi:uncharacterized protein LOC110698366 [Chenopodium quinoa]|uniref:uncharacterized protein LOC110698366 n=1 Tax=Chenopodium quinoa TaxID=63459 RepID=UPI000B78C979|nr:uncharacterized protein LOC110698366 [Chenopodium quinoa]
MELLRLGAPPLPPSRSQCDSVAPTHRSLPPSQPVLLTQRRMKHSVHLVEETAMIATSKDTIGTSWLPSSVASTLKFGLGCIHASTRGYAKQGIYKKSKKRWVNYARVSGIQAEAWGTSI